MNLGGTHKHGNTIPQQQQTEFQLLVEQNKNLRKLNESICCLINAQGAAYNTEALVYVTNGSDYDVFANYPNVHSISISIVRSIGADASDPCLATLQVGSDTSVTVPAGFSTNFTAGTYLLRNIQVLAGEGNTGDVVISILY